MRKSIVVLFLCAFPSFCTSFGAATAWDVQTTGSNTNGGGFDSGVGSPGTFASTAVAFTDLICATTTCTSVTLAFSSSSPGNFLYIASGSGCNTGPFEILSQSAGTATLNVTAGTGTCTGTYGGSLASPCSSYSSGDCQAGAMAYSVTGNTIWIKSGTYTMPSGGWTSVNKAGSAINVTWEGYGVSHGDFGTIPLLTSSATTTNLFSNSSNGFWLINLGFSFTGASEYSVINEQTSNAFITIYHCKLDQSGSAGGAGFYQLNSGTGGISAIIIDNEFAGNSTSQCITDGGSSSNGIIVENNYCHGAQYGIYDNNNSNNQRWTLKNNVFSTLTRGVYELAGGLQVNMEGNSFYNITNECAKFGTGGNTITVTAINNICYGATYGIYASNTPSVTFSQTNFFGNISTANYHNFPVGINSSDIALSASPYTSTSVFTLNNTAGGGASVKAAGFPGITPAGTGYIDGGALQSKSASGTSPHGIQ